VLVSTSPRALVAPLIVGYAAFAIQGWPRATRTPSLRPHAGADAFVRWGVLGNLARSVSSSSPWSWRCVGNTGACRYYAVAVSLATPASLFARSQPGAAAGRRAAHERGRGRDEQSGQHELDRPESERPVEHGRYRRRRPGLGRPRSAPGRSGWRSVTSSVRSSSAALPGLGFAWSWDGIRGQGSSCVWSQASGRSGGPSTRSTPWRRASGVDAAVVAGFLVLWLVPSGRGSVAAVRLIKAHVHEARR
jgi:hypothetical protein